MSQLVLALQLLVNAFEVAVSNASYQNPMTGYEKFLKDGKIKNVLQGPVMEIENVLQGSVIEIIISQR